jgi:hypothetical protein
MTSTKQILSNNESKMNNYYSEYRENIPMEDMFREATKHNFFPIPLKIGKAPKGDYRNTPRDVVRGEIRLLGMNKRPQNIGIWAVLV